VVVVMVAVVVMAMVVMVMVVMVIDLKKRRRGLAAVVRERVGAHQRSGRGRGRYGLGHQEGHREDPGRTKGPRVITSPAPGTGTPYRLRVCRGRGRRRHMTTDGRDSSHRDSECRGRSGRGSCGDDSSMAMP
jgi:hypothetical protein